MGGGRETVVYGLLISTFPLFPQFNRLWSQSPVVNGCLQIFLKRDGICRTLSTDFGIGLLLLKLLLYLIYKLRLSHKYARIERCAVHAGLDIIRGFRQPLGVLERHPHA